MKKDTDETNNELKYSGGNIGYPIQIGNTVIKPKITLDGNGKPTGVGIGISFSLGKRAKKIFYTFVFKYALKMHIFK